MTVWRQWRNQAYQHLYQTEVVFARNLNITAWCIAVAYSVILITLCNCSPDHYHNPDILHAESQTKAISKRPHRLVIPSIPNLYPCHQVIHTKKNIPQHALRHSFISMCKSTNWQESCGQVLQQHY